MQPATAPRKIRASNNPLLYNANVPKKDSVKFSQVASGFLILAVAPSDTQKDTKTSNVEKQT